MIQTTQAICTATLSAFLLASIANAQVSVVSTVTSPLLIEGCSAPCGPAVPTGTVIQQFAGVQCCNSNVGATALDDGVSFRVRAAATTSTRFERASGQLLADFTAWQSGNFRIEVRASAIAFPFSQPPSVSGVVDIGDDGTPEAVTTSDQTLDLIVPANPQGRVPVRITGEASAPCVGAPCGPGAVYEVTVRFEPSTPPPATITRFGTPCGADLSVVDSVRPGLHQLGFTITSGFANGPVVLGFGVFRAPTPIPIAPGCFLETPLIAAGVLQADATGTATTRLDVLSPIQGTLYAQAFPFDFGSGILRTTHGIEIALQD